MRIRPRGQARQGRRAGGHRSHWTQRERGRRIRQRQPADYVAHCQVDGPLAWIPIGPMAIWTNSVTSTA